MWEPQDSKPLWEPGRSRSGFPAGAALSIAVARSIAATGFACLLPVGRESGRAAVVRAPVSRDLAPPGVDSKLEASFANLRHPKAVAQLVVLNHNGEGSAL